MLFNTTRTRYSIFYTAANIRPLNSAVLIILRFIYVGFDIKYALTEKKKIQFSDCPEKSIF
jgi:hypothetical protein